MTDQQRLERRIEKLQLQRDAFQKAAEASLAREQRLRALGDEMAARIEDRWTGVGDCPCRVCEAAREWRREGLFPTATKHVD